MRKLMIMLVAVVIGSGLAFGTPANPIDENLTLRPGDAGGPEVAQTLIRAIGDPVDFDATMQAGAAYIRQMQADITEDNAGNGVDSVDESPDDPDDGGWDWLVNTSAPFSHTTAASSVNLYGTTALGLYYAYLETPDAALFTAMQDAADFIVAAIPPDPPRSGSDMRFLLLFNDLYSSVVAPTTVYADVAKAKYDDRITAYGSATLFAQNIRDIRGVTQNYPNGIIAWDIGIFAVVAQMLYDGYGGTYDVDADSIAEVLWQDSFHDTPGLFDVVDDAGWDPTYNDRNFWWYTLGVTGLIDAFDASATHTDEISGLVTRLLDSQFSGGGISYCYGANTDDEDWQSTAYAMMTLGRLDQATYQDEINRMGYWTGATQDASGGWVYGSGNHYPEVCAENTAGLYFTTNDIIDVIVDSGFTSQADVDVYNIANSTSYVWGYDAFATIQEGIDAVTGSTVHVAAGTYNEAIAIDKSLTLSGADGAILDGTGLGTVFAAVQIMAGDVVFDNFLVQNYGGDAATDDANGIVVGYESGSPGSLQNVVVSNCAISDIETDEIPDGHTPWGCGIYVGYSSLDTAPFLDYSGLIIEGNQVSDVSGAGLTLASVTGNSGSGQLKVLNNTVESAGIASFWIDCTKYLLVQGNVFNSGLYGIQITALVDGYYVSNTANSPRYIEIVNNIISNSRYIPTEWSSGTGVLLFAGWPADIDVHYCSITGNEQATYAGGVQNHTSVTIDVRNNWWGAVDGPSGQGPGSGDAVSAHALFDPWLSGNIVFVPDPEILTAAVGTKTISVDYLGGGSGPVYGYNVSFTWDNAVVSTSAPQVTEGNLLADQGATQWFTSQMGNTITVHNVLLGAQPGVSGPGTMFTIQFDAVSCDTSVINLTLNAVRDNNNQPLTGFYEDDGLIYVDQGLPSFTVHNPWPDSLCQSTAPSLDLSADANCGDLDNAFYKYDTGAWTSDPNLFTGYAGSAWANGAWVLPAFSGLGDGSHTVYFYCTDDFGNVSATIGWDFIKDTVDPPPVTAFASAPGHDKTHLSWTNPGSDFNHVVVVRKAWAPATPYGYADYAQPAGGYPVNPLDGVVVYSGTAESFDDDPIVDRSIYFYRAFSYDCADNWAGGSPSTDPVPAAFAQGDRTTSYWLGDVAGSYDGLVNYSDITALSGTYWLADGEAGWNSQCDVGPTDDWSRVGIPLPDDYINFEDLIVFAMNFGVVDPSGKISPEVLLAGTASASSPILRLEGSADEDGFFRARLILDGNRDQVKGMSVELTFDDALEFVSAGPSDPISAGMAFFMGNQIAPGRILIDLAALGTGRTIQGSGDIALLTFRVSDESGEPGLRFGDATLRGAENAKLDVSVDEVALSRGAEVPSVTRLVGAVPNPFNPMTTIAYELSTPERVTVSIYDANGRLVRTLVDQSQGAGFHEHVWNGRDNSGRACASGIYLVRMNAGTYGKSAKVVLLK